ncbi:MAG: hypothetical protein JNJ85_16015, partial [Candidatus Kapabacteria bacterium]|nr:hypothetical protein [Candidatus Kapabacteria bacterium]
MINRRHFLQYIIRTGAVVPFLGSAAVQRLLATEPDVTLNTTTQSTTDGKIIVLLRLFGGNDGLNTFIPYQDEHYFTIRNEIPQWPMA